uniref:Uncharacterized protein n=1 Tax=Rhizophora mucronata TaxID=61149 RepID=A0A2P2QFL5_RHIMU
MHTYATESCICIYKRKVHTIYKQGVIGLCNLGIIKHVIFIVY